MEASKLLAASIVFFLVFAGVRADGRIEDEDVVPELLEATEGDDSSLRLELEQLRSKISDLESTIAVKARDIKSKDEGIAHLEEIIQDKSSKISSLQNELQLLQKKGTVDAEELVGKVRSRVGELEKQVEKLRSELDLQNKERDIVEARANEAEKKVEELNLKFESLQQTNDEQKHRIRKTERALHVAEEELVKAQLEARAKLKELKEVHGAWLPPWLAAYISHGQELASTYWKERGQPALDVLLQKASEKSAQAQKWVEPHLETAKTKWLPALRERYVIFVTNAEPYVQTIRSRTIEAYEASKKTLEPHVIRAHEVAHPYLQEARKWSKPYIEQIATITKPHVDRLQVALKPYKKHVVHTYGKFLKSAATYHHQVQAGIKEHLKKHELTKSLATKELVWFMASALLVLPIFIVYRIISDVLCSKDSGAEENGHGSHNRRRAKRRHG